MFLHCVTRDLCLHIKTHPERPMSHMHDLCARATEVEPLDQRDVESKWLKLDEIGTLEKYVCNLVFGTFK